MAVLALGVFPLGAQDIPRFGEMIEVRRAQAEVVVTDARGNPVVGLQPSDFLLFEGGQPVEITNFSEVRDDRIITPTGMATRGADSSAAPERRIVIFIDNDSIPTLERNQVLDSARKLVATFGKTDLVMIVTWNRGMKLAVPFTNDQKLLAGAIDDLARQSSGGAIDEASRRITHSRIQSELSTALLLRSSIADAYDKAISHARAAAEEVSNRQRNKLEGLRSMIATLSGTSGRKAVVFLGRSLPQYPALETFLYADEVFRPHVPTLRGQIEGSRSSQSPLHRDLARYANASDVAFYPIFVGDVDSSSAENQQRNSQQLEFADFTNSASSMQMLAEMTGGAALHATRNYDRAFAMVRRDLSSYYSMAWKPLGAPGAESPVEVRMKNLDLQVRFRSTHREKSFEEQTGERVVANLFHTPEGMRSAATLITGTPKRERRGQYSIPVQVRIPLDAVTLLPDERGLSGEFCVWVVVANEGFDQSPLSTQCQPVSVPDPASAPRRAHWTYDLKLLVRQGANIVSVGVQDRATGEISYARAMVNAGR
jgi:VWFA-related protein